MLPEADPVNRRIPLESPNLAVPMQERELLLAQLRDVERIGVVDREGFHRAPRARWSSIFDQTYVESIVPQAGPQRAWKLDAQRPAVG
jgi:hypothetical protein